MKKFSYIVVFIVVFVSIFTMSINAMNFDDYVETYECVEHDHTMDNIAELGDENELVNSYTRCSHVFAYNTYSSSKHMKVCIKSCGYGVLESHTRNTCYATSCYSGCGQSLPSAHSYSTDFRYVGDYAGNDRHANVCISNYMSYCGYYTTSYPCNATGEIWTSTFVTNGVHVIYRECGGCGIGVEIGSSPHYSGGNCIPGCRG